MFFSRTSLRPFLAAMILVALLAAAPALAREPRVSSSTDPASIQTAAVSWPDVALRCVTRGAMLPTHITGCGDMSGRLFVSEKGGLVRIIEDGAFLDEPFLDLSAKVGAVGEQGLMSVAFAPDYTASGLFYASYTDTAGDSVIARFQVSSDPDKADPASEEVVLTAAQPQAFHNNGQLAFGPDGYLYAGMGDGGGSGDPWANGQDPTTLLGSILRLDVSGTPTYTIPASNPFVGHPTYKQEIWDYGLRNPWRFSFDRDTGALYIADVGQSDFEEIDYEAPADPGGRNYGWNMYEGSSCFQGPCDPTGKTFPVWEYDHSEGRSVTGGFVYRGSDYPALDGIYVYGDFINGKLWGLTRDGGMWTNHLFEDTSYMFTSFGEGDDGSLYAVDFGGTVLEVVDRSKVAAPEMSRAAGQDRYMTAIAASTDAFPEGADAVVIATGEAFPDALAASGLAGSLDAPILLTRTAALPDAVVAEIARLGATEAIVVGATGAVSAAVEGELVASGLAVSRIGGADRYATAALVARALAAREGDDFGTSTFIATGELFPDALAASPLAFAHKTPVLLVTADSVPEATRYAVADLGLDSAIVLGETGAVSEATASALGIDVERVGGETRYETAASLALYARDAGMLEPCAHGVATGADFPDALSGGSAIGRASGALLLTRPDSLPPSTATALAELRAEPREVLVFGGTGAVSETVYGEIGTALAP